MKANAERISERMISTTSPSADTERLERTEDTRSKIQGEKNRVLILNKRRNGSNQYLISRIQEPMDQREQFYRNYAREQRRL